MLSLESQIKTAADNAQNRFGKDIITDRYEFPRRYYADRRAPSRGGCCPLATGFRRV